MFNLRCFSLCAARLTLRAMRCAYVMAHVVGSLMGRKEVILVPAFPVFASIGCETYIVELLKIL